MRKEKRKDYLLIDVREKVQYDLCSLGGSINVPFSVLQGMQRPAQDSENVGKKPEWLPEAFPDDAPIYIVCRLGNDSQVATRKLRDLGVGKDRFIGDISGGLRMWKKQVDPSWPEY